MSPGLSILSPRVLDVLSVSAVWRCALNGYLSESGLQLPIMSWPQVRNSSWSSQSIGGCSPCSFGWKIEKDDMLPKTVFGAGMNQERERSLASWAENPATQISFTLLKRGTRVYLWNCTLRVIRASPLAGWVRFQFWFGVFLDPSSCTESLWSRKLSLVFGLIYASLKSKSALFCHKSEFSVSRGRKVLEGRLETFPN